MSQRYSMRRTRQEMYRLWNYYERRWYEKFRLIHCLRFDYSVEVNSHILIVDFRNHYHLRYELTIDELRMGGIGAVVEWFHRTEADIDRYHQRFREETRIPPREFRHVGVGMGEYGRVVIRHPPGRQDMTATEVMDRRDEFFASAANRLDQLFVNHFANEFLLTLGQESIQDKVANKKAADLFRSVAGEAAYKRLESGEGLSITGSKGTDYLLHKKASYCIERPSDGAKLCAVVPGVPLWDHLLGIKLMVENDEPLFLKTANVSGGNINLGNINLAPGAINWWADEQEIPAELFRDFRFDYWR